MSENEQPNIDAWEMTGYATENLRHVAQLLRENLSGIEVRPGVRSENDTMLMQAIEGLCIAADRIDRLHQDCDPVIVQIAMSAVPTEDGEGDYLHMFGLDSSGKMWQYMFASDDVTPGWYPMQSGKCVARVPSSVVPIDKGKH